jgi:hypothetical protein
MGVRLYPRTEDPHILETLAEVPVGTMGRLNQLKARLICTRKGVRYYHVSGKPQLMAVRDFTDLDLLWEEEFNRVHADGQEDCAQLSCFLDNGWGKLSYTAAKKLVEFGHGDDRGYCEPCGHLDDLEQIADLLVQQDLLISAGGAIACRIPHNELPRNPLVLYKWVPVQQLGGVQWN